MLMESVVSLVSFSVSAPPFTAIGEAVSEVSRACTTSSAVVSVSPMDAAGAGAGAAEEELLEPPPPQELRVTAAASAAAVVHRSLRFMRCAPQSLALVGDPASGVLR
jgi:hypothetical protein